MRLAWEDYIARINRDKALYGQHLDPLDISNLLDTNISQSILGYEVEMSMWNISLHGLSQLVMKDLKVLRSAGLNDVQVKLELEISELVLRGLYQMDAVSWLMTDLSSEGEQEFTITIDTARIILQTELVLGSACGQDGAVVSDMRELSKVGNSSAVEQCSDLGTFQHIRGNISPYFVCLH